MYRILQILPDHNTAAATLEGVFEYSPHEIYHHSFRRVWFAL